MAGFDADQFASAFASFTFMATSSVTPTPTPVPRAAVVATGAAAPAVEFDEEFVREQIVDSIVPQYSTLLIHDDNARALEAAANRQLEVAAAAAAAASAAAAAAASVDANAVPDFGSFGSDATPFATASATATSSTGTSTGGDGAAASTPAPINFDEPPPASLTTLPPVSITYPTLDAIAYRAAMASASAAGTALTALSSNDPYVARPSNHNARDYENPAAAGGDDKDSPTYFCETCHATNRNSRAYCGCGGRMVLFMAYTSSQCQIELYYILMNQDTGIDGGLLPVPQLLALIAEYAAPPPERSEKAAEYERLARKQAAKEAAAASRRVVATLEDTYGRYVAPL